MSDASIDEVLNIIGNVDCKILPDALLDTMQVNDVLSNKRTALVTAVECNKYDMCVQLQKRGASVDILFGNRKNALHAACSGGSLELVQLLIQYKADVDIVDGSGMKNALMYAIERNHLDIVKYLVNSAAGSTSLEQLNSALFMACRQSFVPTMEFQLENHADVDAIDLYAETPLYNAACQGDLSVVKTLLKYHAEIDVVTEDEQTPLYIAAYHGHTEVAEYLIAHKASINTPNYQEWTPQFGATAGGHTATVKLLLSSNADVSIANEYGLTPAMLAKRERYREIIPLFTGSSRIYPD